MGEKKQNGGTSVKDYFGYENEEGCQTYYHYTWEATCYYENPDDLYPVSCDPPIITSEEWLYTICPGGDPYDFCSDPVNFDSAECNPDPEPEIINNVTDTCLKKTVNSVLNNDVVGKISEILSNLDSNTNVHIKVFDAEVNSNGRAGQTGQTSWDSTNSPTQFTTSITLSRDLLLNSTKEHAASVFIHEIVHAYFRQNTGKKQEFEGKDHADMAANFVGPMAEFLSGAFGISLTDATALAWNGIDAPAFTQATSFTVGSGSTATTISREELGAIATKYTFKLDGKGTGVCQ